MEKPVDEQILTDEDLRKRFDYESHKKDRLGAPSGAKLVYEARISYDGKQFVVRLPKEVSDLLNVVKGKVMKFILTAPKPGERKVKYEIRIGKSKDGKTQKRRGDCADSI